MSPVMTCVCKQCKFFTIRKGTCNWYRGDSPIAAASCSGAHAIFIRCLCDPEPWRMVPSPTGTPFMSTRRQDLVSSRSPHLDPLPPFARPAPLSEQHSVLFPRLLEPCPTLPFVNALLCQSNAGCRRIVGLQCCSRKGGGEGHHRFSDLAHGERGRRVEWCHLHCRAPRAEEECRKDNQRRAVPS